MADTVEEVVERVARVICEEKGYDPDSPINDTRVQWQAFTELATAIVERLGLCEVTEEMLVVGGYEADKQAVQWGTYGQLEAIYLAMDKVRMGGAHG